MSKSQNDTFSSKFILFGSGTDVVNFKIFHDGNSVYIYSYRNSGTSMKIAILRESKAAPISNFDTTGMTEILPASS